MNPGFSCASCIYFSQFQPVGFVRPAQRGQCRRHAPVLHQNEEGHLKSAWPMVHEDSWCGEHAYIEEPLVAGQRPQPSVAEAEDSVSEETLAYRGPEWRCINCKHIERSPIAPDRCFVCRCGQFEKVAAALAAEPGQAQSAGPATGESR